METLRPNIMEVLGDPYAKEAFSNSQRRQIRKEQGGCCEMCGGKPGKDKKLEIHHKIPQSHPNSTDTLENAVGLCSPCHQVANRMVLVFNVGFKNLIDLIHGNDGW